MGQREGISIQSTIVIVPSSELAPLTPASVPPPPGTKEVGGNTRLWVRGWGGANSDDRLETLALCILCEYTAHNL